LCSDRSPEPSPIAHCNALLDYERNHDRWDSSGWGEKSRLTAFWHSVANSLAHVMNQFLYFFEIFISLVPEFWGHPVPLEIGLGDELVVADILELTLPVIFKKIKYLLWEEGLLDINGSQEGVVSLSEPLHVFGFIRLPEFDTRLERRSSIVEVNQTGPYFFKNLELLLEFHSVDVDLKAELRLQLFESSVQPEPEC
jgi:hypothetical protein